jgi:hypothetical protein
VSFDIAEAKRRLPLPDLLVRLGLGEHAKARARCPWTQNHKHGDKQPSFGIFQRGDGWGWKCFVCGGGDEITFLERYEGLSNGDAIRRYCELAGVNGDGATTHKAKLTPPAAKPERDLSADWQLCAAAFTDEQAGKLATWRGYSADFVTWLRNGELVGLHEGKIAFPVHDDAGRVVALHYREKDGTWRYHPTGCKVRPLVIGDTQGADVALAFESQWDAFAVLDKMGWHKKAVPGWCVIVTRGASNGKLVRP